MKQRSILPRVLGSALATTMVATVATVGGLSSPAAAEPVVPGNLAPSSWSYVDSTLPTSNIKAADPDVPVGSWRDASNVLHTTRSYITFDPSAYAGRIMQGGQLVLDESWAASCPKRAIEVWQTENNTAPTWNSQPRALRLLGTFGDSTPCPTSLTLSVNELVADAVATGQRLTFMVRVPAAKEGDTQFARRFPYWTASRDRGVRLRVSYLNPPMLDNGTRLVNGQSCASATPPRLRPITLGGVVWDDGGEAIRADFAFWPVNDPTRRTVVSVPAEPYRRVTTAWLPEGAFTQGVTYGWALQGVEVDEEYRSAWSTTCTFVADLTSPARPTVTSANYPENGTAPRATPGQFTFAASGSTSTVAYQYGFGNLVPPLPGDTYTGAGWVKPTAAGGSATITLVPPAAGQNTLRVRACDAAQRCSTERTWTVNVPDTTPTISLDGPVYVGVPFTVTAAAPAGLTGVTAYDFYPFNATTPKTVAPNPDGTGTRVDSVPETQESRYRVAARLANGWVTPQAIVTFQGGRAVAISSAEYPAGETSGGVGVPGTFTLTRATDKVTTFRYYVNSGTMIPGQFDANGRATINWTPTTTGFHRLVIQIPTTVGGNTWYSMAAGHDFYVAG